MSPVQMESSAPACTRCGGEGSIVESECPYDCPGSRGPEGCTHGLDFRGVCPRCDGSRIESCDSCGDPATHKYVYNDTQFFCDECDPEEPKGDSHPMGGMGYGISYAHGEDR